MLNPSPFWGTVLNCTCIFSVDRSAAASAKIFTLGVSTTTAGLPLSLPEDMVAKTAPQLIVVLSCCS